MTGPVDPLHQPSLSRSENSLANRWTPIIGARYARIITSGRDSESRRFLLLVPLGVGSLVVLRSNLAIGDLILLMGFILLAILEAVRAKRLREIGMAMLDNLRRLGLAPKSNPPLKRIPTFKRWLTRENLTCEQIREAGSPDITPEDTAKPEAP